MKREEFLSRVAAALGRDGDRPVAVAPEPPAPPPPEVVSPSTGALVGVEELLEHFTSRARALGVEVQVVADVAAARARAAELVSRHGASVCASAHALARAAAELATVPVVAPADADVGVTVAWRAVAETGTVVLRAEDGRLAGALPPVHLVLLPTLAIRPDLVRVFRDLGSEPPSALVQVTGPSRTADIEMTLTTGVHGPGTVIVLVYPDDR
jgi:L-lactate dehydrogenase complex protein LldG